LLTRYSNSSTLRLVIGRSRYRIILHALLCVCVGVAAMRIYSRGYPLLALSTLPAACLLLWQLYRQPLVGTIIRWQQGSWSVEHGASPEVVSIGSSSVALPWGVYLAWQELLPVGGRRSVWLFADSVSPEQLRRLRVRLALER
jgi:hypothetical protein